MLITNKKVENKCEDKIKLRTSNLKYILLLLLILIINISFVSALSNLEFIVDGNGNIKSFGEESSIGISLAFAISENPTINQKDVEQINQFITGANKGGESISKLDSTVSTIEIKNIQKSLVNYFNKAGALRDELKNLENINKYAKIKKQEFKVNVGKYGCINLIKSNGQTLAQIPLNGYELKDSNGEFRVIRNSQWDGIPYSDIKASQYFINNQFQIPLKINGNIISLKENSEVLLSEEDGKQIIKIKGVAESVKIENSPEWANIKDLVLEIDENNEIQYAKFISPYRGSYTLNTNNRFYRFIVEKGGTVIFNPKENKISGDKISKLSFDNGNIESKGIFSVILDKDKGIKEIILDKEDKFRDLEYTYSSKNGLRILFNQDEIDGKLIKDYNGDIVSINTQDDKLKVKGFVEIQGKVNYKGLSKDAYTEFDKINKFFDVQQGDAKLDNYKHEILIKDGIAKLRLKNFEAVNAESFGFSHYTKTGLRIEGLLDEKEGLYNLIAFKRNGEKFTTSISIKEWNKNLEKTTSEFISNAIIEENLEKTLTKKLGEIDKDLEDIDKELEILEKQQGIEISVSIPNLNADLVKERIKELELRKDELELRKIVYENEIGKFNNEDIEKTVQKLRDYLEEETRDNKFKEIARLELGKNLIQKSVQEIPKGRVFTRSYEDYGIKHVSTYFQYGLDKNGNEIVVAYSPDGKNFVSLDYNPENFPLEKSIPHIEKNIIKQLQESNGDIEVLEEAVKPYTASYTGEGLSGEIRLTNSVGYGFLEKDLEEARELLRDTIKNNKELEIEAGFAIANSYIVEKNYESALKEYEGFLENPNKEVSSEAYRLISNINLNQQDFQKAMQNLDKSIQLNPENYAAIDRLTNLEIGLIGKVIVVQKEDANALLESVYSKFGSGGNRFSNALWNSWRENYYLTNPKKAEYVISEFEEKLDDNQFQMIGADAIRRIIGQGESIENYFGDEDSQETSWNSGQKKKIQQMDFIANINNFEGMVRSEALANHLTQVNYPKDILELGPDERYEVIKDWLGEEVANEDSHYFSRASIINLGIRKAISKNPAIALIASKGDEKGIGDLTYSGSIEDFKTAFTTNSYIDTIDKDYFDYVLQGGGIASGFIASSKVAGITANILGKGMQTAKLGFILDKGAKLKTGIQAKLQLGGVSNFIAAEFAESIIGETVGMISPNAGLFTELVMGRGRVFDLPSLKALKAAGKFTGTINTLYNGAKGESRQIIKTTSDNFEEAVKLIKNNGAEQVSESLFKQSDGSLVYILKEGENIPKDLDEFWKLSDTFEITDESIRKGTEMLSEQARIAQERLAEQSLELRKMNDEIDEMVEEEFLLGSSVGDEIEGLMGDKKTLETILAELQDKNTILNDFQTALKKLETLPRTSSNLPLEARLRKIQSLAETYRSKLKSSGVWDDGLRFYEDARSLASYRHAVEVDLINFLKNIHEDYDPNVQRVFLGSDGADYTMPAYKLLTGESALVYDINRKMLATPEELAKLYDYSVKSSEMSNLDWDELSEIERKWAINQRISSYLNRYNAWNRISNVRLYDSMDHIIGLSAEMQRSGIGEFEGYLENMFESQIMGNPQSRQKVLELVSGFVKDVDLTKEALIIDYLGTRHVQSHTLKQGIEWLSISENWNSLTESQKIILGNNPSLFENARVGLKLGVGDFVNTQSNPLQGLGLEEVWEIKDNVDSGFIEATKSRFMDPEALLRRSVEYLPTDANQQAMTWAKRMMLVDAISESGVGIRTSAEDIILPLAEVAKLSDIKRLDYAEKLLRRNGLLGFGDVLTEAQKKQILSAHYTELAEGGVARIRPKVEILESFTIEQRRVLMDRGVTGSNVKSSLIDESKLFYNVRRIDSSTTRSAYGSNKVTESNLYDLFSYEYRGLKEAKAITYLDEVGDYHIRFWSMGEGNTGNSIHHRDALSDLIDQEAESLIKQALNTEDEILLELGLQRKEIAKSISLNRVQSSFPEDILKRSQGALLILDRTGKIRYFYIDSSILSTQISRGQTISAKKLSETIRFLHESIDPELRAYNFVHIKGLGSMKLDGELSLPDNLQAIELVL